MMMLKRTFLLLLFSASLYAGGEAKDCDCNSPYNELSTTNKILVYSAIGAGAVAATAVAVAAAPLVLPASVVTAVTAALASAKVAIIAGSAKVAAVVIPTTKVGYVSCALKAGQLARPYVFETIKEKVNNLEKENTEKAYKAESQFISCLKQNKIGSVKNAAGRPNVCEDAALFYALVVGCDKLDRRTQAFNTKQCFCYADQEAQ
jgi:hypothetical protein